MKNFVRSFALICLCTILFGAKGFADENCCPSFPVYAEVNASYDSFRGISEGSWNGNEGGVIGVNVGISAFGFFGVQAGGSYGVYDWQGREPVGSGNFGDVQHQGFITGGVFYKTPCESGFQGGVVIDWMFNTHFGVFGLNPSFGQARFQAGYVFCETEEVGLWGTAYLDKARKSVYNIPVAFRAINQLNVFWRHQFQNCAETMVWAGIPYGKGLIFSGKRPGKYIIGASFSAPLTSRLSVEGHAMYMGPQSNYASPRFMSYGANICVGLTYWFGCPNDSCNLWEARPYMPIGNNSNFLVDTSLNN
jgi:hypothetical protein